MRGESGGYSLIFLPSPNEIKEDLLGLHFTLWPQIRQDYPLNLSILISGGKETNKDSLSNGEWSGNSSNLKSPGATLANCSLEKRFLCRTLSKFFGTRHQRGWESRIWRRVSYALRGVFEESGCLGMQPKMGGKFHLKLNTGTRPIANKYREGKMKSTLKRELNSTWSR